MLSRYRMRSFLCLDNQKRPICLGFAEHAPRHNESFPGQPCKLGAGSAVINIPRHPWGNCKTRKIRRG